MKKVPGIITMNPERSMGQPARYYNMPDLENVNDHAFNQQDPVYHPPQIRNVPRNDQPVQLSAQRPDILPIDPVNNYYVCPFCRAHYVHMANVSSIRFTSFEYCWIHSIHSLQDESEFYSNITSRQHNEPRVAARTITQDELHELFRDSSDDDDISEVDFTENESYEDLLRLDESLQNPHGLDKQKIESLVSFEFNDDRHQGNQTSCVVCMFEFEPSELIRMLPCSHEFHAKCIDKWFQAKTTCPICRKNISDCNTTSD